MDGERDIPPPERERLQHPGKAEVVVGVEVREEDVGQVDEPDVGSQQLPLGSLTTVDEQPLTTASDERRGRTAGGSRRRAGRAEEHDVEIHPGSYGSARLV